MIKAYKLICGPDGHSYVQKGILATELTTETHHVYFKETQADTSYDWHNAPQTQYVLSLKGTLEFTTSLGDTFILKAGEVLIATDTEGFGHKWRILGDDPWIRAYAVFDPTTTINFISENVNLD